MALQLGHRVSIDFDLFSSKRIKKNLLGEIKNLFPNASIKIAVNNPEELTIFLSAIKITFLRYPFPIVSKLVSFKGLKLLSVTELAATKAYTIGRRGTFKDYADLFFVLKKKRAKLGQIIEMAQKKYGNNFNTRLFLEQLIYLNDIKDEKIKLLNRRGLNKKQIREYFQVQIKNLQLVR